MASLLSRSSLRGVVSSSSSLNHGDINTIITKDNKSEFSRYIASCPDELDEVTDDGKNLVMRLCEAEAKECLSHLIATYPQSLNLAKKDKTQATCLHYAARSQSVEIAQMLFNKGVSCTEYDCMGKTPIHLAAENQNLPMLELFLQPRVDVSAVFRENTYTPLHIAAKGDNLQILELVARRAGNINIVDSAGQTAMHYAVLASNALQNCQCLSHGAAQVNVQDANGHTPLISAIRENKPALVRFLIQKGANTSLGALHPLVHAYIQRSEEIFFALIQNGAKIDEACMHGQPLMQVLTALGELTFISLLPAPQINFDFKFPQRNPQMPNIVEACLVKNRFLEFSYCLAHDKTPLGSRKPLIPSAIKINAFAVALLLQYGEDPNIQDSQGNAALHFVEGTQQDTIDLLLSHHANIELKNNAGQTPLAKAYHDKDMKLFTYLLKKGASPDVVIGDQSLLQMTCDDANHNATKLLIQHGADRNLGTPLLSALRKANTQVLELLLQEPAVSRDRLTQPSRVNVPGAELTPLVVAIGVLYAKITKTTFERPTEQRKSTDHPEYENILLLLKHGADVNSKSKNISIKERTIVVEQAMTSPLLQATKYDLVEVVRELLNHGAKAEAVEGNHPLTVGCELGRVDIIYELINRGAKIPSKVLTSSTAYSSQVQAALGEYLVVPSQPKRSFFSSSKSSKLPVTSAISGPSSWASASPSKGVSALVEPMKNLNVAGANSSSISLKTRGFSISDTCTEAFLRDSKLLAGTCLMFKPSRLFPGSLCRLAGTMDISIGNELVIQKGDIYPKETSRDEKTIAILSKLLPVIHEKIECVSDLQDIKNKIAVLSRMDAIDEHAIQTFDIYVDGHYNPRNRDMIVLRLLSKEAALMAIMPVSVQIGRYAEAHSSEITMRPQMMDQWVSIDIEKTLTGVRAEAKTVMSIKIDNEKAATFDIFARVDVEAVTGAITITLERKNLVFMENVRNMVKLHIYAALNSCLTTAQKSSGH